MADDDEPLDGEPVKLKNIGPKEDLFDMHIQMGHENYGTQTTWQNQSSRFEDWENNARSGRAMSLDVDQNEVDLNAADGSPLLKDGDALFCEWDDNLRTYYFGDDRFGDRARWNAANWEEFIHPEYKAMQEAANASGLKRGITLQDCLDEFTKEEQLGEDDLWYCPQCKKHQQAKKKFDLWSVPDILVVHLKRFSNSRILRDKIDVFVDFPTEGLDLEKMVGEREIGKRLQEQGFNVNELGINDLDEPLTYDLYAVDEHLGGLGGGHYRAYAKVRDSDKWYHYDDTYVSMAQPREAVVSIFCFPTIGAVLSHNNIQNANAYLLFYRRRTSRPIGGKTFEKIEAAKFNPLQNSALTQIDNRANRFEAQQLPTPPDDSVIRSPMPGLASLTDITQSIQPLSYMTPTNEDWPTPLTNTRSSPASSLPGLDDGDPPSFDDSQFDDLVDSPPMLALGHPYARNFGTTSPTSSIEAEPDLEDERDEMFSPATHSWSHQLEQADWDESWRTGDNQGVVRTIDNDYDGVENPFEDQPISIDEMTGVKPSMKEIPVEESTLLDIDI